MNVFNEVVKGSSWGNIFYQDELLIKLILIYEMWMKLWMYTCLQNNVTQKRKSLSLFMQNAEFVDKFPEKGKHISSQKWLFSYLIKHSRMEHLFTPKGIINWKLLSNDIFQLTATKYGSWFVRVRSILYSIDLEKKIATMVEDYWN